jgi:hypothetical protein
MTENTVTLVLTTDQLRALEYIVDDWNGSVDPSDVEGDSGAQHALAHAGDVYELVERALNPDTDEAADSDAYVENVQVEIMHASGAGADLTPEEAVRVLDAAGVPVRSKVATKTQFDGSYLVDVDAVWYIQLGDGGSFQGTAGGYDVDVTHD